MANYIKLHGVRLPAATQLPRHIERPEDVLKSIPGWSVLTIPDYTGQSGEFVRNIELGEDTQPRVGGATVFDSFPNGATAVYMPPDHAFNTHVPMRPMRPDAWTVFYVASPDDSTHTSGTIWQRTFNSYMDNRDLTLDDIGICIEHSRMMANTFSVMIHSNSNAGNRVARIRTSYFAETPLSDRNKPTVIMWTFSTRDGFNCYDGGIHVHHDDSDKRPINIPDMHEHMLAFQNCRGRWGASGILNEDLSKPAMAGYREMLLQFLVEKYDAFIPGITEPVDDLGTQMSNMMMTLSVGGEEDEGVERPEDAE